MATEDHCPFCESPEAYASNSLAFARYDRYPASPGHTLIIPRRHFVDLFEATADEWGAFRELIVEVKYELDVLRKPMGYNIGANVGFAAGQTIMHAHIHLIPRYEEDVADAGTSGMRHVIPGSQP